MRCCTCPVHLLCLSIKVTMHVVEHYGNGLQTVTLWVQPSVCRFTQASMQNRLTGGLWLEPWPRFIYPAFSTRAGGSFWSLASIVLWHSFFLYSLSPCFVYYPLCISRHSCKANWGNSVVKDIIKMYWTELKLNKAGHIAISYSGRRHYRWGSKWKFSKSPTIFSSLHFSFLVTSDTLPAHIWVLCQHLNHRHHHRLCVEQDKKNTISLFLKCTDKLEGYKYDKGYYPRGMSIWLGRERACYLIAGSPSGSVRCWWQYATNGGLTFRRCSRLSCFIFLSINYTLATV